MECTQRLECTQDLSNEPEKTAPDQIGYLGICGSTYPVKVGPNKIGRDPQTCEIVLDNKSLSRQHAVINVLNPREYMLMDLGSLNKTKLGIQTLQPYIPYPMKNGDTVQFGDVFGIFRLFEEEHDELPMTQAIGIPDTPVFRRNLHQINAHLTTVPESPDVSDKDDSFIGSSQQPKGADEFKSPKNHFIKPSNRTVKQPAIGSSKIDNVFWNSAKRSPSLKLQLDDSNDSLNTSLSADKLTTDNVHEMETQNPCPGHNDSTDSIYTASTQIPETKQSPSIHSLDTQVPFIDKLPAVQKLNVQREMTFELSMSDKENDDSLIMKDNKDLNNAETQLVGGAHQNINDMETQFVNNVNEAATQIIIEKENINDAETQYFNINNQVSGLRNSSKDKNDLLAKEISESDEEILLEEFENSKNNDEKTFMSTSQKEKSTNPSVKVPESDEEISFEEICQDDFENMDSQPLLIDHVDFLNEGKDSKTHKSISPIININRNNISESEATICEDIDLIPTQCIQIQPSDEDSTDGEQDEDNKKLINKNTSGAKLTDSFEELPTQIIENDLTNKSNVSNEACFEDMPTQVIFEDSMTKNNENSANDFDDMPTQILENDLSNAKGDKECDMASPFKIPLISPIKVKRKDLMKLAATKNVQPPPDVSTKSNRLSDEHYYDATQQIFDDLCTQIDKIDDDEVVPCSVEDFVVGERFRHLEEETNQTSKLVIADKSSESDMEEKVQKYVSSLSTANIKSVIGVNEVSVVELKNNSSSDLSDIEVTPKKKLFKFTDIELPNSQEIKNVLNVGNKTVTESSSESETDDNDKDIQDQDTPILFKAKKRRKTNVKLDLTKKLDFESLPTRVITRVRKPTSKAKENEKSTSKILKPTYLVEQEENVDTEIITENISRLKKEMKKSLDKKEKQKKESDNKPKLKEDKKEKHKDQSDKNTKLKEESDKKTELKEESNKKIKLKEDKKEKHKDQSDKNTKLKEESDKKTELKEESNKKTKLKEASDKKTKFKKDLDTKTKLKEESVNKSKDESRIEERKTRSKDKDPSRNNKSNEKQEETKRSSRSKDRKPIKDKEIEEIITLDSDIENETVKKTRSTRTNAKKDSKPLAEKEKKQVEVKTKRLRKKDSQSPESESLRRSERQRTSKEKNDSQTESQTNEDHSIKSKRSSNRDGSKNTSSSKDVSIVNKTTDMMNHEQSTVYNLSSGSGIESPSLKRSASEALGPSPKRTRSVVSGRRSTPAKQATTQHVLFTAFPNEAAKAKLEKLGAILVSEVSQCTVLVTLQIKRTFKLLCTVGLGKPIVGPNWVQACVDNNTVVDPWLYIIKDDLAEKRFKFSLQKTLSGRRNFLRGYSVSSTPAVMPNADEMKLIVESSGGTWKEGGLNWLCVSSANDKALWPNLKRRGAIIVSTELILGGVLRQKLDINGNKLS